MRNSGRPILLFICVFLLGVFVAEAGEGKRPNILLIYTDDHSYRTISCYPEAHPWARTPNIDRLAQRGVRFTHAYTGTWCMPARATLLTGLQTYGIQTMRETTPYPASEYDKTIPTRSGIHGCLVSLAASQPTGIQRGVRCSRLPPGAAHLPRRLRRYSEHRTPGQS